MAERNSGSRMAIFSMKFPTGQNKKRTTASRGFIKIHLLACRHNLQYWRSLPYLAFGAGAHGYANGYRYSNVLRIKTYIDRLSNIDDPISNMDFPAPLQPSICINNLNRMTYPIT